MKCVRLPLFQDGNDASSHGMGLSQNWSSDGRNKNWSFGEPIELSLNHQVAGQSTHSCTVDEVNAYSAAQVLYGNLLWTGALALSKFFATASAAPRVQGGCGFAEMSTVKEADDGIRWFCDMVLRYVKVVKVTYLNTRQCLVIFNRSSWQDELAWSWVLELGWLDSLWAAWEQTFSSSASGFVVSSIHFLLPQSLLPQNLDNLV